MQSFLKLLSKIAYDLQMISNFYSEFIMLRNNFWTSFIIKRV